MRRVLLGSCVALCLAAGAPALTYAQQGGTQTQTTAQRADRNDGQWGWLGLLGLAGLIGLRQRHRHDDVRPGHTTAR
jgi:MYXO-CTERM domain-containing protein